MRHDIFRFIPVPEIDPAFPNAYAYVMYDDVSELVAVFDEAGQSIRPKAQAFEDVGAQYTVAGYYFTKQNRYPFAVRGELVPPPPPVVPEPIYGCMDPAATNYSAAATADDGTCEYAPEPVFGCTDPTATNHNPNATSDDGTCQYAPATFLCQEVEVRPCEPRGVFLRWRNRLGGVEGWLFTGQVDTPHVAEALGEHTRGSGLQGASVKTAGRGMVVRTAGLSLNRWEALCEIFTSPLVWIHYPDHRTEEVYCKPAGSTYSKNQKELEVEISRVPHNTLTR